MQRIFYIDDEKKIVAAGPLTLQPSSTAYRFVIREQLSRIPKHGKTTYSVHRETFDENMESTGYSSGTYISEKEEFPLIKAVEIFSEKLAADAENHYGSLYREEQEIQIHGAYGTLICDAATGDVRYKIQGEYPAYQDIVKIDVKEYVEWFGVMDDTDIALVGFWTNDGKYVPPDHEVREARVLNGLELRH